MTTPTENALRRQLKKEEFILRKSRTKNIHAEDFGGYMIIDANLNAAVSGSRYKLTLMLKHLYTTLINAIF